MNRAKHFILFIIKFLFSVVFLLFKTIFKQLSIVLPYESFDYKNTDNNRPRHFKVYVIICSFFATHLLGCYLNSTSEHIVVTLDILFLFYLLIPFLFKTYSKYLPLPIK